MTQSWYDSIEIFFSVLHFVIFSNGSWLLLFSFETTQRKSQFDTNLVRIRSALIEISSFSCFVLFIVTAGGGHLVTENCKKSKLLHAKITATQSWYNFIEIFFQFHILLFK